MGDMALAALTERAEAAGIEALALSPRMVEFNEDCVHSAEEREGLSDRDSLSCAAVLTGVALPAILPRGSHLRSARNPIVMSPPGSSTA